MTLSLSQSATAIGPNGTAAFLGIAGTEPYVYAVLPGGAGGTVNPSTGLYTAPSSASSTFSQFYDTIEVSDDDANTATAQILVGPPLLLFCEIIQRELGLSNGRVYLWDQKLMQPTDSGLYVAVSVPSCKPFANVLRTLANGDSEQFVSMLALVDLDIISRGPEARDRKEEVIMALKSIYSQQQQEINAFYIATLSTSFINLSNVDGAAIPYRYRISVHMQYSSTKTTATPYVSDFSQPTVYTNP